jgi:hypothetical protein
MFVDYDHYSQGKINLAATYVLTEKYDQPITLYERQFG